ncbi:phosphotransferase family protein [Dongia sp.]|uniref:phosphotransferase family protein n=1 Tax=Dongia sp. TaxID=1977262 RepID=UPI0035B32563
MLGNKIAALESFLGRQTGAGHVGVKLIGRLGGGAIQENWAIDLDIDGETLAAVLRADAPSGVAESWGKAQEFAILKAAVAAGMKAPEPLWLEPIGNVIGQPFHITRRLGGSADPRKLVRNIEEEEGDALARELGAELAKLHKLTPAGASSDLAFLPPVPANLIAGRIARFRGQLDRLPEAQPVLEWAINRLEDEAPNYARGADSVRLCHRDFRSGNYLVHEGKLSGILDFEFAGWSDPYEDLGWFCARCWRFGMSGAEAGGIGRREAFYEGYVAGGGDTVDDGKVRFWEQMAALRWAIMSLEQAERHLSGRERSIELALTGLVSLEMEYDLLVDLRLPGFKPTPRKRASDGDAS